MTRSQIASKIRVFLVSRTSARDLAIAAIAKSAKLGGAPFCGRSVRELAGSALDVP
jgi:hypothetical protein